MCEVVPAYKNIVAVNFSRKIFFRCRVSCQVCNWHRVFGHVEDTLKAVMATGVRYLQGSILTAESPLLKAVLRLCRRAAFAEGQHLSLRTVDVFFFPIRSNS